MNTVLEYWEYLVQVWGVCHMKEKQVAKLDIVKTEESQTESQNLLLYDHKDIEGWLDILYACVKPLDLIQ